MKTTQKRYGSLIKVKPEFEERYIILHKHTFPGVLAQIRESNIRNYSICLRDGILFSYFEYVGEDFKKDMESMGQSDVTRDWWKLTDPMQEPFASRKKGEWWASLEEVFHYGELQKPSYQTQKYAFTVHTRYTDPVKLFEPDLKGLLLQNLSVFHKDEKLYLYLEDADNAVSQQPERLQSVLQSILQHLAPDSSCTEWHSMKQVFHLDGNQGAVG